MKVKRALVSVSDKTGLDEFVKGLDRLGIEIISTGGTAAAISSLGIKVIEAGLYTGFPEILGGRVKTLHPKIHAALLALRDNPEHMRQLEENEISSIDMVVVNLYPFEETVSQRGVTSEEALENIDIGGPSMLRSAAKNFKSVAVVSSPCQYARVLGELEANACEVNVTVLKELAVEVFKKVCAYDSRIAEYLGKEAGGKSQEKDFPNELSINIRKIARLRYGENPHQRAAFYRDVSEKDAGIAGARQIQGKELSFNNIMDLSSALEVAKVFKKPSAVIIKHNNPCGAASAETLKKAYVDALDSDRISSFGSVMGFNRKIDEDTAKLILKETGFIECVIAPEYSDDALAIFKEKKNLRLLKSDSFKSGFPQNMDFKKVSGGVLVQDPEEADISFDEIKTVTKRKPDEAQIVSLMFGWQIVKYVKSNAIVLSQGTKTVGIGAGQMSRVDAVIIAVHKSAKKAKGAVLASDAFFPKRDAVETAHKAGISAIIQPGGSIRDDEIIDACNRFKISMVFTGKRHFRH
ncbi:MAG: bifunctional phosphoribosylaminoimidazolecarboxamide formyltransferase/IMP cyclohydrolase [Candidatus Omnitrophota bacterium]